MDESFTASRKRWGNPKAIYMGVMSRLGSWLGLHVAHLYCRPIDPTAEVPCLPSGYTMRVLSVTDLHQAAACPKLELTERFLDKVAHADDYCVGVYCGDQLVSYVWRAFSSTAVHNDLKLSFPSTMRYGYKALTLAEHRGLRLQHSIALLTEKQDYERGVRFGLSYIETHNFPSIASGDHRPNSPLGLLVWIHNRWLNLAYVTPTARRQGIAVQTIGSSRAAHA